MDDEALLPVATGDREGIEDALLGSLTEPVLRSSILPVLTVPL